MIRNFCFLLAALLTCSCSVTKPPTGVGPLKPVGEVSLGRYAGKWYEVARYPQWFQRGCVSATAEYTPLPGGRIRVVNTCFKEDGKTRSISGSAEPVDSAGSRLRVRFSDSPVARWVPVPAEGNYWIVYLSSDYRNAVVGTPDRESLWLLSRSPEISKSTYEKMRRAAEEQGFDTTRLEIDKHTRFLAGRR